MSALEQDIIKKFRLLDNDARNRVRAVIERESGIESDESEFDYAAWRRNVERIRSDIRTANEGEFPVIDVVGMLREIRDGDDE